jgi:hypothetical protein
VNAASSLTRIDLGDSFPSGLDIQDPSQSGFSFRNHGFGLDVGARYKLNDKIEFSASIVDLGYINWREQSYTFSSKNPGAEFYYDGVEVNNFFSDSNGVEQAFERLGDTLIDRFNLEAYEQSYLTRIFSEFYLGGNVNITDNHNAGVLFYGSWYNRRLYPAFTVSWNSKFGRVLGASVAWSYMNRSFANLGAGLSLNGGPVQFYVVSDNIFSPIRPTNTRSIDLRFGMNVTLLRKKKGDTGQD